MRMKMNEFIASRITRLPVFLSFQAVSMETVCHTENGKKTTDSTQTKESRIPTIT